MEYFLPIYFAFLIVFYLLSEIAGLWRGCTEHTKLADSNHLGDDCEDNDI